MIKRTSTSILAVSGIVITVAIMGMALFAGVAGAQLFPMPFGYPFGYGGYSDFGYPGFDGFYGMPGPFGTYGPFGMPGFGFPQTSYGVPSIAGPQMPYGMPSYGTTQAPVPYTAPEYTGQQMPLSGQPVSTGTAGMLTIPGLEGLAGFMADQNKLSLAVIPVSQQNGQLGFQVIGFAISGPGSSQAAVYSLSTPLAGVIDPTQNTLQIDLSGLANNINQAGYIASDQIYNTIRSSPQVIVIEVDMTYQGAQGTQTIFNVNSVAIIPPDGRMQAFAMQQPTQLIIDSQSMRIYMVAFPQMINAFTGFYGMTWPQVLPIVYVQPVPILAPIFVPFLQPFPIFFSGFVSFNPFFFGSGFVSFFNKASFHGGFPIRDRDFGVKAFSQIAGGRAISSVGGRFGPDGFQVPGIAGIGADGGRFGPVGIAGARAPGVSVGSIAAPTTGIASVRAPGVSIGSGVGTPSVGLRNIAAPSAGFASVQAPGVSIGSGAGIGSGIASVRAPGVSIGSGVGTPSFAAGNMPSFGGIGRGVSGLGGAGFGGAGLGGMGGSGVRIGGGRR